MISYKSIKIIVLYTLFGIIRLRISLQKKYLKSEKLNKESK